MQIMLLVGCHQQQLRDGKTAIREEARVGEEGGVLGTFVVVLLYVALLVRIIILAERQRSTFSRVYGYCIAGIIFVHFAINIGMTIGLVPVIGIPLPFLSYGGSSMLAFTIMLAIFVKQDANRLNVL